MKKLFFATIIIFFVVPVYAQYAQDEIQEIQKEWGKEKKELVRIGMELPDADAQKFWPIYEQYEKERQKIGKDRIMILNDYAGSYASMTNSKADELIKRIFKNEEALAKLQQQYYNKVKSALNAMQAAKFLHIESYINSTIKSELQGAIPVIGELDSLKTSKM